MGLSNSYLFRSKERPEAPEGGSLAMLLYLRFGCSSCGMSVQAVGGSAKVVEYNLSLTHRFFKNLDGEGRALACSCF